MYIISGCLLGENCKYNGGNNHTGWVADFARRHSYISVCPETEGGLKAPRPPVEIVNGRAVNKEGTDVTEEFKLGCERVLRRAYEKADELGEEIEGAILKAKSPSCGSGKIYDGTFSHTVTEGDGFLSELLKGHGIKVITEEDEITED